MDYARASGLGRLAVAVVLGLTAGCQSLVRGTSQDVTIETEPAGASVQLSDGQRCTSPCRLTLPRSETVELSAAKAGCRTAAARLTPAVSEDGFVFATVFDHQLGGAYDIDPSPLTVTLACGADAESRAPGLTPADEALLSEFGRYTRESSRSEPAPLR